MSQHVLDGAEARAVHDTIAVLISALRSHAPLTEVPALLTDAESLRGTGLLAESRLAEESVERIERDRERLFGEASPRGPIAPLTAPPAAAAELARLREELVAAGVTCPGPAAELVDALDLLAALEPGSDRCPRVTQWRRALITEHLLTWGARALSRMQLGAQTFFYQGVATLGLGLLRHLSDNSGVGAMAG